MVTEAVSIKRPLCVDIDGTLLATDTLWESLLLLAKKQPVACLLFPLWLLHGKAYFKRQLAQRIVPEPAYLPYREEVLSFLKKEKETGRNIILASASDQYVADRIAHHVGIFSGVLGSDGKVNLSGKNKLKVIESYTGSLGFDYIGNSRDDLPLWKAARRAILVHPSSRVLKRARVVSSAEVITSSRENSLLLILKALRVHQWVKNVLLLVPIITAHKLMEIELVLQAVYAFLAFSLCASSAYILNDLLDLEADRQHPYKRHRPFAAGQLEIKTGVLLIPVLLGGAFLIAGVLLPPLFAGALTLYLALTTAYSFSLKAVLIIDVLVLAALYTLRVLAGGIAVDLAISPWLLAFSMFLFLSLAFLKRYSELRMMQEHRQWHPRGRKYILEDIDLVRSVGVTSGYISVLVFALYISSKEVMTLYQRPVILWFIGPCLLYWLTRMWFLAHRGQMADDPIVFAVKDRSSCVLGALVATLIVVAS